MGLIIGGSSLGIAMFMMISHYRRERSRARILRHLNRQEWGHQTHGRMWSDRLAWETRRDESSQITPERTGSMSWLTEIGLDERAEV